MKISRLAFGLLVASGLGLSAQGFQFDSYGFQAGVAMPQQELKTLLDGRIGYTAGVHALFEMGNGHALVPRMDYTVLDGKEYTHSIGSFRSTRKCKVTALGIGVDYNYFLSGKVNEGLYFGAGLGISGNRMDNRYSVSNVGDNSTKTTKNNVNININVGYMFNSAIGLDLRYIGTRFDGLSNDDFDTWIGVGAVVRFGK